MDQTQLIKMQDLGLQENEAKVYLALLEIGRGTVSGISRVAKLNRTTSYDILERLSVYGLANRVAGKKKIYMAESPHRLRQFLENKKRSAERRLSELSDFLPNLSSLYKTDLKPVVKFTEGKEEMMNMYLHKLEAKSTIYSILNLKGYSEDFDEMGQISSRERFKKGIKEQVLALKNETAYEWWKKVYEGNSDRQKNTEYRWLEPTMREYPNGEINIFDDTVIIMLTKPGEYIGFEIQSASLAAFLKIMFELTWSSIDSTSENN